MAIKEQLQKIVEKSRADELEFIERLSEEDRAEQGSYTQWSAKDTVAHVNYWPTVRSEQIQAWLRGDEVQSIPQYQQANLECYEMFADKTWAEIEDHAQQTHDRMQSLLQEMDEESLSGPSWRSEEHEMWQAIAEVAYSHKLIHYSDYYIRQGRSELSGRLWSDWAELVSSLDAGEPWQGRVHYNAACGLALAGDRDGAIDELRTALNLQPSLKAWSRKDSDLAILHKMPEFKELVTLPHWWEALEAGAITEAMADQFLRSLTMFRTAVESFTAQDWLEGDTNYQRPAGLALHIAQTISMYSAMEPGDSLDDGLMHIDWESPDASSFPTQVDFLTFLNKVEEKLAKFLLQSDLSAEESQFPWTGSTVMSRALYTLRHTQHHLAHMTTELQKRGSRAPDWS